MKSLTLVVPGPITTQTGGSIYDRRMADGLGARGWTVDVIELDPFVHPLAPPLETAGAQFAAIPDQTVALVDGLAFGTMPEVIDRDAWRLRFVPIVHMPLPSTPGLTRGEAAWLSSLERRALAHAHHIVVTGAPTRDYVRTLIGDAGDPQITRIPPGTDPVPPRPRARSTRAHVQLLCVANLTWGKGHDILLQALWRSRDLPWTLTCVGSPSRNSEYAAHLKQMAQRLELESRVIWLDADHDRLPLRPSVQDQFSQADLFVLATRSETYGMAVAEAIAHGVPVISTRTGEIPSIVGEGGRLAEPNDVDGFSSVLRQALENGTLRQHLADQTRVAAARLPTWDDAADAMAGLMARMGAHV